MAAHSVEAAILDRKGWALPDDHFSSEEGVLAGACHRQEVRDQRAGLTPLGKKKAEEIALLCHLFKEAFVCHL